MKIGTLKDLQRVQISPEENAVYIEVEEKGGVAIDVKEKTIENLKDVFEIDWENI